MKNLLKSAAIAACVFATSTIAQAHEIKVGDLVINHPVARATLPNAPVAGGYMTIENTGTQDDKLVAGSADFAGKVEIHEMKIQDNVMKMRAVDGGLVIPAGEKVVLEPGGLHVMFMKLGEQLKEGEKRDAVLTFEKAGDVKLTFNVKKIDTHNHGSHGEKSKDKGHNHDHSHGHDSHKKSGS